MSKVSKLKQEAYQASKRRDWDKVVVLYEHILEQEQNNPALINELGDAYLKKGSIPHAIQNFLSAAEKYRLTGLHNNAIAIYKKVLRLDTGNLSAHWYLAETRAGQQMAAEGLEHALRYLAAGERVPADYRDAYLKRCVRMLGLYASHAPVLERLAEIFAHWNLPAEKARVTLAQACLAYDRGEKNVVSSVASLLEEHPELTETPEHNAWLERVGGSPRSKSAPAPASYADVNTIQLDGQGDSAPADAAAAEPAGADREDGPLPGGTAHEAFASSGPASAAAAGPSQSLANSLGLVDLDGRAEAAPAVPAGLSLDELTKPGQRPGARDESQAPASAPAPAEEPPVADSWQRSGRERLFEEERAPAEAERVEIALDDLPTFADLARELQPPPPAPEAKAEPAAPVDLLAEILADDNLAAGQDETAQVSTIADEISAQVGGAETKDPEAQYNMGLVYLEMGLFDQAADCFASAAMSTEHALRSYEMWGIALVRQERYEEAIDVLGRGLRAPGARPEELLGLLYNTGDAYERAGRMGAAREYYERVYQISPQFLDTERRLEALESY